MKPLKAVEIFEKSPFKKKEQTLRMGERKLYHTVQRQEKDEAL